MKLVLLLLCLFAVGTIELPTEVVAEQAMIVDYILPRGTPFISPDFSSGKLHGFIIEFSERFCPVSVVQVKKFQWYKCRQDDLTFFLPDLFTVDEAPIRNCDKNGNIPIGEEMVDRLSGIPLSYIPSDLVDLPLRYHAKGYEWRKLRLRKEAADAFEHLIDKAREEGIKIGIISAFRDAHYQAIIYQRALIQHGIDQKSVAKPGHSEHQLGTACDLTTDEIGYALSPEFENTKAYKWLIMHSPSYGIYLTYPKYKQRLTSYIYEPWHFRYWGAERWKNLFSRYTISITR